MNYNALLLSILATVALSGCATSSENASDSLTSNASGDTSENLQSSQGWLTIYQTFEALRLSERYFVAQNFFYADTSITEQHFYAIREGERYAVFDVQIPDNPITYYSVSPSGVDCYSYSPVTEAYGQATISNDEFSSLVLEALWMNNSLLDSDHITNVQSEADAGLYLDAFLADSYLSPTVLENYTIGEIFASFYGDPSFLSMTFQLTAEEKTSLQEVELLISFGMIDTATVVLPS